MSEIPKLKGVQLFNGECLEVMDELIEQGVVVDAIICDPPYGTTSCKWDSDIDFNEMWVRLNKLIKPNGAIVLFGSEPFSSALRMSNIKNYKYDWVWEKSRPANFMNAKYQPMKYHENIFVFSNGSMGHKSQLGDKRMIYNPQDLVKVDKIHKRPKTFASSGNTVIGHRPSHKSEYKVEYENYPKNILKFSRGNNNNVHPTQKPVALMGYLIKTYTNEGETVLDFTMGSGSTGVACVNLNRKFIGIEMDKDYFEIAGDRIEDKGSLF